MHDELKHDDLRVNKLGAADIERELRVGQRREVGSENNSSDEEHDDISDENYELEHFTDDDSYCIDGIGVNEIGQNGERTSWGVNETRKNGKGTSGVVVIPSMRTRPRVNLDEKTCGLQMLI